MRISYTSPDLVIYEGPTDNFSVHKNGRMVWLQKILFSVLDWLGCRNVDRGTDLHVKMSSIDTDDVKEAILDHKYDVDRMISYVNYYGMSPDSCVLIIGRDLFEQAVDGDDPWHAIGIHGDIFGMQAVIVPWFESFLIVPMRAQSAL